MKSTHLHRWRQAVSNSTLLAILCAIALVGCDEREPVATPPTVDLSEAPIGPLFARIRTANGEIRVRLRPDEAPVTCANFVNLVDRGFFDGLRFYRHSRVIRQAGNPYHDPERRWSPGYTLTPEFSPDLRFDVGGRLAMLRVNDDPTAPVRPNEFFLTTKPQTERFTFVYPIFGEVVEGQEVVDRIRLDDPIEEIVIEGDARPLLERHRDRIGVWNEQLDKTELGRRRDG